MPKIIDSPRQRILQEAERIVLAEGYKALSMRKIAENCDMAVGTLYNYFPNKKELIVETVFAYWEEYMEVFERTINSEHELYVKIENIYCHQRKFMDRFKNRWVDMLITISPDVRKDQLAQKHMQEYRFVQRQVASLAKLLDMEAKQGNVTISESMTAMEVSQFIILNVMMMSHLGQTEYGTFEKILRKILS